MDAGDETRMRNPFAGLASGPLFSFHLLLATTALLTTIGLVMVQTSSSFRSAIEVGSPFGQATRQLIYVGIGVVLFYVALRLRLDTLRRLSPYLLGLSLLLLLLVLIPGIGVEVNGSRAWFDLKLFAFQPGEFAKLVLILWGSAVTAAIPRGATLRDHLVPLVPMTGFLMLLVFLEPDQGMATLLGIVLLSLLWFGGLSIRLVVGTLAVGLVLFLASGLVVGYRTDRLVTYWHVLTRDWDYVDPQGAAYQVHQGLIALADGGVFGIGLGQSRASRGYLPEATNDFIFAIVGEQLGWVGASFVIGLFVALGVVGMRIAVRSVDPYAKMLAAVATMSLVSQAFINIGYVVGLLPVTGLQLPLISAGGTSTVTTLFLIGVLANAARHEPEAISTVLAGGESRLGRILRLPAPVPYEPPAPRPKLPGGGRTGRSAQRFGTHGERDPRRGAARDGRRTGRGGPVATRGRVPREDVADRRRRRDEAPWVEGERRQRERWERSEDGLPGRGRPSAGRSGVFGDPGATNPRRGRPGGTRGGRL